MLRARQYALAAAVAGSVGLMSARSASAQFVSGQFGAGNTWNVYEFVTTPAVTWDQARVSSTQRTFTLGANTFQGHLVTVLSAEENTFVNQRAPGDAWIGLSDSDQTSLIDNVAIGGTEAGTNPNGGWKWVTGEAFSYQAFGGGEPNDSNGEDAVHKRGDGLWNDHQAGDTLNQGNHMLGYFVEYEVRSASKPIADPPPPAFLNIGPSGGRNFVGIREVKTASTPQITSTLSAIQVLQDNNANPATYTRFEGTAAMINHSDPDAAGGAGGGFGPRAPFLSNAAGDDEDFAYIANGTIRVPQTGVYTFQVRGDDGFRLKIDGAEWTVRSSAANSAIGDRDVLLFNPPTGDSNTFAITNLTAGDHRIEFIFFERGGGAFTELSSALGDFSIGGSEFKLIGDFANGGLELVPEPASLGLLGFGALGLLARRRRPAGAGRAA